MARYLSAAKIGLLVLTELYVEEAMPSDAVMPVLSFIASHLIGYDPNGPATSQATRWKKAERSVSLVISIKDFEKLLGSYPFLVGLPGKRLWDQFLSNLWGIDSLHSLGEFFERISSTLSKTREDLRDQGLDPDEPEPGIKLSHNSPLGAFVRRSRLEYQNLAFHDCTELWEDLVRYREPTRPHQNRKNPDFGRYSFDSVLLYGELEGWEVDKVAGLASAAYGDMLTGDRAGSLPVSTDDVETLLEFQIEQMQKYGNRTPLEIRHKFHDLLNGSLIVPSLRHYLAFLDAWRAGDYPTAFDFLHRYFDYTMEHRDRLFYQYALMNLAVLQADFGCHKEAMTAMLETVATARENRDITCLNFSLNWLFHFGQAHPHLVRELQSDKLLDTGKETLAFLRAKAKETGMWTLWSSVLLSEAKLCLIHGDSIATAFELLVRSSQIIVEKNMKGMLGQQFGLHSSLWGRLGLGHLAAVSCEVFLRCHTNHSMFDDEMKMICRLSLALLDQGKYREALEVLDKADENSLRSWRPSQHWHKYRGIVRLGRDLNHNNLGGAEQLLGQFLQTKGDDFEPDLAFAVDAAHINYLMRRGDLSSASEKVDRMESELQDESRDIYLRVKALLIRVSLLDRCGRPQRAFSLALRAANLCLRARLISLLWHAIGAVSNILVSMGEFEAAAQLLTAVLPRSLECESPALAAKLYSYLADASMGLAGQSESDTQAGEDEQASDREREAKGPEAANAAIQRRDEHLARAAMAVQRAFDEYSSIEDINSQCEMMAKKAVIMKVLGDMTSAAGYAAAYVELKQKAQSLSVDRGDPR
ncbi:anaphase-promoting complex subunit 5 [Trichoderma cornu-damae]|uniref:Anaphase-promoting complex subunit 5 n=1 Tax=Trichoderma cornu-damae TaxID=654480 RepID=A0A9P8QRS0_9HYPO|nr:anaphase-promoting complex subunit 5 [Trichoderma cornu-damae]